jgi:hypothetical protein
MMALSNPLIEIAQMGDAEHALRVMQQPSGCDKNHG